jgi:hypothetical protein
VFELYHCIRIWTSHQMHNCLHFFLE